MHQAHRLIVPLCSINRYIESVPFKCDRFHFQIPCTMLMSHRALCMSRKTRVFSSRLPFLISFIPVSSSLPPSTLLSGPSVQLSTLLYCEKTVSYGAYPRRGPSISVLCPISLAYESRIFLEYSSLNCHYHRRQPLAWCATNFNPTPNESHVLGVLRVSHHY